MDIAKIRKKLKEDQQTKAESKPDTQLELKQDITNEHPLETTTPSDNDISTSENEVIEEKEPIIKTTDIQVAKTPPITEIEDEIIEFLTFSLINEEFAFRINHLHEILRYQRIATVPKMPKYVLGITSLRGKIIPVLSLRLKLSLTEKKGDDENTGKILILKGTKGPIGVIVDKVIGVVRIPKSELLPPPSHLSEAESKYVEGVAVIDTRFISILNIEEITSIK